MTEITYTSIRKTFEPTNDFKQALEFLINAHGIDSTLNIPDYILVDYILDSLKMLNRLQEKDYSHYNNV